MPGLLRYEYIYGLIVPVLPSWLPTRTGIPQEEVQFWTSAMLAAFGFANLLGSPFLGWLANRSPSRKISLLLGLLLLGTATVMLSLGTAIHVLVVSWFFQDLSAAIIYTGGLALVKDTVGLDEIGKSMGFVLSFANAGFLILPTLGGPIYGKLGANAIFLTMGINVMLDIILRLGMVEKAGPRSNHLPENGDRQPVR